MGFQLECEEENDCEFYDGEMCLEDCDWDESLNDIDNKNDGEEIKTSGLPLKVDGDLLTTNLTTTPTATDTPIATSAGITTTPTLISTTTPAPATSSIVDVNVNDNYIWNKTLVKSILGIFIFFVVFVILTTICCICK